MEKIFDGLQIVAAQQDSMLQQQYTMGMNVNQMMGSNVSLEMVLMPAPPPPPSIQPPDPTKIVPVTPQEVVNRMRIRFYMFLRKFLSDFSEKRVSTNAHCYLKVGQFKRGTQTTSARSGAFRTRITTNHERVGRG